MEVALLWVVADLFCEEVERVCVVAEGLDVVVDPDEDLETVAEDLDQVEPEALGVAELEGEREELDLDEDEEDEDPVEPLCEVVVVDLRV